MFMQVLIKWLFSVEFQIVAKWMKAWMAEAGTKANGNRHNETMSRQVKAFARMTWSLHSENVCESIEKVHTILYL